MSRVKIGIVVTHQVNIIHANIKKPKELNGRHPLQRKIKLKEKINTKAEIRVKLNYRIYRRQEKTAANKKDIKRT